jgi:ATP-dependent DNA helicase RecG
MTWTESLVGQFMATVGATRDVTSVLRARSLLTRTGDVTNAGYLLFGTEPQDVFPQAYIRIIRFLSAERGTGARLGVEEGQDVRVGPLPKAIQEAGNVIEEFMPRRRLLAPSGRFEAQPIVPRDAWLEGVVNAVIHRSYSLAGDHIRVELYPNRVEIESPGRFPGLADPGQRCRSADSRATPVLRECARTFASDRNSARASSACSTRCAGSG